VPEALLNVKRHLDIRDFLLTEANLLRIKKYDHKFAGVMSDVYMIELDRGKSKTLVFESARRNEIPKKTFLDFHNHVFAEVSPIDLQILDKVKALPSVYLSSSDFALGVVTGGNEGKIFSEPFPGSEPIITGKEVSKYLLSSPRQHILFIREKLQQVAPDKFYRAPAKLVYKVIGHHLKFALDETGTLTTNSANIVIPNLPSYNPHSLLGLLNSDLYSYLYVTMFGGVNKVAKENLMALPFPMLSPSIGAELTRLVENYAISVGDREIQEFVNRVIFQLSDDEVLYVERAVAGKSPNSDVFAEMAPFTV
jgi:hypothetical protein